MVLRSLCEHDNRKVRRMVKRRCKVSGFNLCLCSNRLGGNEAISSLQVRQRREGAVGPTSYIPVDGRWFCSGILGREHVEYMMVFHIYSDFYLDTHCKTWPASGDYETIQLATTPGGSWGFIDRILV
jgi:hypothetical protein